MKQLRWLLLLLLPLGLFSCTDTREELELKSNGSGTLALKTDLGKMLEMLKGFGGDDQLAKDGLDRAFDTTMLMKDYVDTAKDITPDKKELLRDGKVHLIMNVKESIGKLDMNFPFSSTDKLQLLYQSLNSTSGGLKSMFGGVGKNIPNNNGQNQGNEPSMGQISSVYDITVKDGLYSRKVNQGRYEDFTKNMKLEEFKQVSAMFGTMDYTFIIKLPRGVKKITNNTKATVSDDKKTVTIKTDLMETMEHPQLLAVDIAY